jgi:serine/threonine-protein kinase
MGQVVLAHDPVLDRVVAIKHLRNDLTLSGEQLAALGRCMEQEARAVARLSHPNLVALHDMGRDPIVGLYLVFEFIEGPTLEERLEHGPLTPSQAAWLSRELGGALGAAHAEGVVHRDIKPENVLLAKTGAKIADFGVARLPGSTLVRPGALLGTPAYSAPEAIALGSFSPASDQFSLACTLYEAIGARRAFPGDDVEVVAGLVQTSQPPELAPELGLDPRVDAVLARAFSKNPASRFESCEEFGEALAEALDDTAHTMALVRPAGARHAPPAPRHHRASSVVGVVAATLGLAAAFALVYGSGWRVSFAQSGPLSRLGAAVPDGREGADLSPGAWLPRLLPPRDERDESSRELARERRERAALDAPAEPVASPSEPEGEGRERAALDLPGEPVSSSLERAIRAFTLDADAGLP